MARTVEEETNATERGPLTSCAQRGDTLRQGLPLHCEALPTQNALAGATGTRYSKGQSTRIFRSPFRTRPTRRSG